VLRENSPESRTRRLRRRHNEVIGWRIRATAGSAKGKDSPAATIDGFRMSGVSLFARPLSLVARASMNSCVAFDSVSGDVGSSCLSIQEICP